MCAESAHTDWCSGTDGIAGVAQSLVGRNTDITSCEAKGEASSFRDHGSEVGEALNGRERRVWKVRGELGTEAGEDGGGREKVIVGKG